MRSTVTAVARHGAGAVAEATLIIVVVAALAIGAAVATNGTPGSAGAVRAGQATPSWIQLSSVGELRTSAQPSLGDYVAFDTGYPKTIKNPRILVNCHQGGELAQRDDGHA